MNFVALHRSDEALTLLKRHPNAFLLLTQIAMRAKYKPCSITKLEIGQAFIGDWKSAGLPSEMAYRHAKSVLTDCNFATFKGTNKGTVANLVGSTIFSISTEDNNGQSNIPATGQQRVTTRKQGNKNNPPTPQGDGGGGDAPSEDPQKPRCLPEGWQKFTDTDRKRIRVNFNTPTMIEIGSAFGRQPTTLWTVYEAAALLKVKPAPEEITAIVEFYQADMPPETDYRRRDLSTLLNNWNGELDRARIWKATQRRN